MIIKTFVDWRNKLMIWKIECHILHIFWHNLKLLWETKWTKKNRTIISTILLRFSWECLGCTCILVEVIFIHFMLSSCPFKIKSIYFAFHDSSKKKWGGFLGLFVCLFVLCRLFFFLVVALCFMSQKLSGDKIAYMFH